MAEMPLIVLLLRKYLNSGVNSASVCISELNQKETAMASKHSQGNIVWLQKKMKVCPVKPITAISPFIFTLVFTSVSLSAVMVLPLYAFMKAIKML